MNKILSICIFSILILSCGESPDSKAQGQQNKNQEETNDVISNPFFAYNFGGLENLTPTEQINLLKEYGYDGITLRMAKAEHVQEYKEFVEIVDRTDDFKIYSVFVRYNFDDTPEDQNRWKTVVDLIQNKGIDLWFIFGKPVEGVNDEFVESILRKVVEYSAAKKVPVTLYPHSWCYFYSAEQSLPMVKKINHPNLKLALHTCHELKAGHGGRLDEVVYNTKDYLSFITIAGAAKETDMTSRKAMDRTTIQPLEDGEYDMAPFLKALKKVNFKGPVGYINFKFDKEPHDYLPKSLAEWNRLKDQYLDY